MNFIVIFLVGVFFVTSGEAALKVTVDPGHGGEEHGAHHAGLRESDLNLKISKKLHKLLQQDPLFESQLTRDHDQDLSLSERVARSKAFHSDIFVSLHANAHPKSGVRGAEFYIESPIPVEQEQGFFAHMESQLQTAGPASPQGDVDSILFDLQKSERILRSYQLSGYLRQHWGKTKPKVIRQGGFYVLNHNQAPAVIIEVGYLTNPNERQKLNQELYQQHIAEKIHQSLKGYAKSMDKLPPRPLHTGHAKTR